MPYREHKRIAPPTIAAQAPPIDTRPAPSYQEYMDSAAAMESGPQAAIELAMRPTWKDDPNYDVVAWMKKTEWWDSDYRDNFLTSESDEESAFIAGQIKKDNKNRDNILRAGWKGYIAAVGFGVLDPTMLIPLTAGGRGLNAVKESIGLSFLASSAQEIPLNLAQQTRTLGESLTGIAAGTIIGGVFGSAVGFLTRAEREVLEHDLREMPRASTKRQSVVGAAQAGPGDPGGIASGPNAMIRALDSNRITASPVTGPLQSSLVEARIGMAQLDDAGLAMENNRLFVPTAEGGTVAVNSQVYWGRWAEHLENIDSAYARYVYDGPGGPPRLFAAQRASLQAYLSQGQKLSRKQFREEVSAALATGDVHTNKFVEEVAKKVREKIFNYMWDQTKAVGIKGLKELPEGVDKSYLTWLPDIGKIKKDPVGFTRFLAGHYKVKLNEQFTKEWEKFALQRAREEEFQADAKLTRQAIRDLRDDLGKRLKGLEQRRETEHFTALQDTIDALRAAARAQPSDLAGETARKQMLKDAKDMEIAAGPRFGEAKLERREIKRRLSGLNQATAALEEKLANKLTKIERAEELSEAGLMRIARKGKRILDEMENWTDEKLDAELSKLKDEFERVAKIYDKGEERIAKLAEGQEDVLSPRVAPETAPKPAKRPKPKGPYLQPAIRLEGKIVKGEVGETHAGFMDRMGIRNVDADYGFINHKGHFLERDEALDYAKEHDLLRTGYKNMKGGLAGDFLESYDSELSFNLREEAEQAVQNVATDGSVRASPGQLDEAARQEARADRMTDIAEDIADAEDLGRPAMRDLIMNMLDESIKRVNKINSKRAVRVSKLEAAAKDLQPEVVAKRLEARTTKLRERTRDFVEKWRGQGAIDTGKDAGFEISGVANFDAIATEAATMTKDKFLGTMLRLPVVDMLGDVRGSMLARNLGFIPTTEMAPWLNMDINDIVQSYIRTMAPDIEMARKFEGDVNAEGHLNKMNAEFNERLAEIKDDPKLNAKQKDKATAALTAEHTSNLANMERTIRRIRHQDGLPKDPDSWGYRAGKIGQEVNVLRMMGGVAIASVPDPGRVIGRYGLSSTFRDGFLPLVSSLQTLQMTKREAKLAGVAIDTTTGMRAHGVADTFEELPGRGTRFEKGLQIASGKIGVVALFSQWTDMMKLAAYGAGNAKILNGIADVMTPGKVVPKKTIEFLAQNGLSEELVDRIWKQVQAPNGANKVNGVWLPNTESWTDDGAVRAYRAAINREVSNTIVTPGLERPGWMTSTMFGKLLGQFKSFGMSSTYKMVAAGLQQRDAAALQGLMVSLALGTLSYYLSAVAAGGKREEEMRKAGLDRWIDEAIDRSGYLAVFGFGRDILQTIPLVSPYTSLSGEQTTRRSGQNLVDAIGGPTLDLIQKSAQVITGLDEPTQAWLHTTRTLLPYNQASYLIRAMNAVERSTGDYFNLPERRQ